LIGSDGKISLWTTIESKISRDKGDPVHGFGTKAGRQSAGGVMRSVWNIVGVLLVLLGSIWLLQGINVLPGSFMSGQTRWAVRGGILIVGGLAALLKANKKQHRAA
jgi:hypothetical protein